MRRTCLFGWSVLDDRCVAMGSIAFIAFWNWIGRIARLGLSFGGAVGDGARGVGVR